MRADEHFRELGKAENAFSRAAVRERAKFDRENERGAGGARATSAGTFAVVSLVVAIRGTETKIDGVGSAARLQDALERLAGDALSDGGENVLAAEVLWTPDDPSEVLMRDDVIRDYPGLIDL